MSLNFPSSQQVIIDRMVTDAQSVVPDINAGLRASVNF